MAQPIEDQAAFLAEASRALQELKEHKRAAEELRTEERQLERALETEKKAVADTINSTVKKRIEEINSSYDKEISKGQERLKKARSKREKAKSQGVKERIAEETEELNSHNRELRLQMRTLFQKEHIPGFCRSAWYYSLYFPRGAAEAGTFLLTVLICFLAVPCGIYFLLPHKTPWYLAGIYFIAVVVFGGLYVLTGNWTKVHHQDVLRQGRAIRDVIKSNNKKIRVITSTIKKDRDEAVYNLEKFDDEIARLQQELTEVANKKKEALNTFDKVTKTILSDEITDAGKEKIEGLLSRHTQAEERLKGLDAQIKEKTLYITDHYEPYVGKEFMEPEKLDELADLIHIGKASTIREAQTVCKESRG